MIELFTEEYFLKAKYFDLLPLQCNFCEEEFLKNKKYVSRCRSEKCKETGKFCSVRCSADSRSTKEEVSCLNCHSLFFKGKKDIERFPNHFCSRSCSASYTNIGKIRSERYKCSNCDNMIIRGVSCSISCHHMYRWSLIVDKIEKNIAPANNEGSCRTFMKRYLIQKNGHQCVVCKNSEWMGKPIPLTCDHIDGDSNNNLPENFRIICANCDRQQPTYGSRNRGKGRKSRRKSNL